LREALAFYDTFGVVTDDGNVLKPKLKDHIASRRRSSPSTN
jgi:hypothetical protein